MSKEFIPGGITPVQAIGLVDDVKDFPARDGKKPWAKVTLIWTEEGQNGELYTKRACGMCYGTIAEAVCDPKRGLKKGDFGFIQGQPNASAYTIQGKEKPYASLDITVRTWGKVGSGGATASADDDTSPVPAGEIEDEPDNEHDPFTDDD